MTKIDLACPANTESVEKEIIARVKALVDEGEINRDNYPFCFCRIFERGNYLLGQRDPRDWLKSHNICPYELAEYVSKCEWEESRAAYSIVEGIDMVVRSFIEITSERLFPEDYENGAFDRLLERLYPQGAGNKRRGVFANIELNNLVDKIAETHISAKERDKLVEVGRDPDEVIQWQIKGALKVAYEAGENSVKRR